LPIYKIKGITVMLAETTALYTERENMLDNELLAQARLLGFGEFHFKIDIPTGLFAIIAIHSTRLGPSLGGCRCLEYPSINAAILDVMRLAQGMSYKAAISNLPIGGGKTVLLKPPIIEDREKYFKAYGAFIETLGGRYITAVDSGTSVQDMDMVATVTKYVTSTSKGKGDPSPYTARGIRRAIEAGVAFKLKKKNLEGVHVAIQGLGHVGYHLVKELFERGAKLTVTDTSEETMQLCATEFGARPVAIDQIYSVACDVFAPCALGAILNDATIPLLRTPLVIGAANNQLAEPRHGNELHRLGILYAPDYVINAGGLIEVSTQYLNPTADRAEVLQKVDKIYDTILRIFERSQQENLPTSQIADNMALERLT
jgi:leucine dehydrogenase